MNKKVIFVLYVNRMKLFVDFDLWLIDLLLIDDFNEFYFYDSDILCDCIKDE